MNGRRCRAERHGRRRETRFERRFAQPLLLRNRAGSRPLPLLRRSAERTRDGDERQGRRRSRSRAMRQEHGRQRVYPAVSRRRRLRSGWRERHAASAQGRPGDPPGEDPVEQHRRPDAQGTAASRPLSGDSGRTNESRGAGDPGRRLRSRRVRRHSSAREFGHPSGSRQRIPLVDLHPRSYALSDGPGRVQQLPRDPERKRVLEWPPGTDAPVVALLLRRSEEFTLVPRSTLPVRRLPRLRRTFRPRRGGYGTTNPDRLRRPHRLPPGIPHSRPQPRAPQELPVPSPGRVAASGG